MQCDRGFFAAAKLHYNSILANVDWLHGSAESFLTLTNLFIGNASCKIGGASPVIKAAIFKLNASCCSLSCILPCLWANWHGPSGQLSMAESLPTLRIRCKIWSETSSSCESSQPQYLLMRLDAKCQTTFIDSLFHLQCLDYDRALRMLRAWAMLRKLIRQQHWRRSLRLWNRHRVDTWRLFRKRGFVLGTWVFHAHCCGGIPSWVPVGLKELYIWSCWYFAIPFWQTRALHSLPLHL